MRTLAPGEDPGEEIEPLGWGWVGDFQELDDEEKDLLTKKGT